MAGQPGRASGQEDGYYRRLLDSLQAVVFELDLQGNVTYGNQAAFDFFGYPAEAFSKGINAFSSIVPEEREIMAERMRETIQGQFQGVSEYTVQRTDGRRFPALIQTSPIIQNGQVVGFRGVILDNSQHNKMVNRSEWFNAHDPLTGVSNRTHFEQELRRMKALNIPNCGVIICDVDGLKLVNDAWGHEKGDALLTAVALILQNIVPESALIARTGGDEFAILLPDTTREAVQTLCHQIACAVSNHSSGWEFPLGTSAGFAFAESIGDIDRAIKDADAAMYLEKLKRSQTMRSAVVETLLGALNQKDFGSSRTSRLQNLTTDLAEVIGFPNYRLPDLRLFARVHDIGKVAIPDSILFKSGPLTPEEDAEMKRHCEIGYRIATSTIDLVPIADWILKHHERWDGKGYPLGLKDQEIPMECRLFAIADAFTAMTSYRPYREARSSAEAIAEIRRCSGTQFDPVLVDKLVGVLEKSHCARSERQ